MTPRNERDGAAPLTPAALHILLALADGPRHGYAIMTAVEESAGDQLSAGPGTIYGCIQRMEGEGLVHEVPAGGDSDGRGRPRRCWRLTESGAQALATEAERLAHTAELVRAKLVAHGSGS